MRSVKRPHAVVTAAVVALAIVAIAAFAWIGTHRAPALGPTFRIQGTYRSGMSLFGPYAASWSIRSDGHAEVTREAGWTDRRDGRKVRWDTTICTYELTPEEVARLRSAIDSSGVFGDWDREEEYCDGGTWEFSLASGDRSVDRRVSGVHAFEAAERFLSALIGLAHVELQIDSGEIPDAFEIESCLRPEEAVRRLRASLPTKLSAESAGAAVATLRRLVPNDEFTVLAESALATDDPARRDAVLAVLVKRPGIATPVPADDPVLGHAVLAIERFASEGRRPATERQPLFRDCGSFLAAAGDARAVAAFERMVRDLSTDAAPYAPGAFAALGDAAVPAMERLLDDERTAVRRAAAALCEGMACELTSPSACARPPRLEPSRASLPFRRRLVPKLERIADDPTADARLRDAALRALAALHLRNGPPDWKWQRLDWN